MSGMSSGLGNANSTMNFNITGVDTGGAGQFQQKQMQDYIKGVATQVAY